MRKLGTIIAAALSVAAFAVVPAAAASAVPVQHRACLTGSTSYQVKFGPPGYANVNLLGSDSPAGCSTVWMKIESQKGLIYSSGHIKTAGLSSAVSTCGPGQGCGGDGTTLQKAWEYKNPGTVRCRKVYPLVGNWGNCTAEHQARTTALVLHRRTCFTGSLSWGIAQNGGSATTSLDSPDSPAGCEQVLTRILTTGGNTYRSGLIRNPGAATAFVKDNTTVKEVWTEKQPNGDPAGRRCRQDSPTFEVNFHPCTG